MGIIRILVEVSLGLMYQCFLLPFGYFLVIRYFMEINVLTVIDILQQTKSIDGRYTNFPVTHVNDHVIRASVMTEPFYWHMHPNSDESFLVVEGSIFIDLEDRTVELFPGQFFTIPRNIKHRTRPNGERSVNVTFELRDMETIRLDQ